MAGDAPLEPIVSQQEQTEITKPSKRIRWATQKLKPTEAAKKRLSLRRTFHRRSGSGEKHKEDRSSTVTPDGNQTLSDAGSDGADAAHSGRTLYFNQPLPASARDEEGKPKAQYPRNKIRTAKYTPLSFIPKDLYFQFHNIANIYFLFIIILQFFSIFGASNPGLGAVPLIFIIVVTAIKDAIEDARRTILDNELNNAPVYRLVDWANVNTAEDKVSPWRKFKKATTRVIVTIWHLMKRKDKKKNKEVEDDRSDPRNSTDTRRPSVATRLSVQSTRNARDAHGEDVEMTTVSADVPNVQLNGDSLPPYEPRSAGVGGASPAGRTYGNLVDNSRQAAGKARFKKDFWKNLQVGDFVRLYNDEEVPADIVVFSTSDPDGACYVETKNLDGETNLKVREALHCGREVKHARDCERTEFILDSEAPHANLYSYSAAIKWKQQSQPGAEAVEMQEPIGINNLLLRGCSLRNTEWILGVVVFTGEETKIMLNSGVTPSKRAQLSKGLNWNVVYNFVILFLMCLISGILEGYTWGKGNESLNFFDYGNYGSTPAMDGFITFWASIILFQNLVPISLYISLEIIRTFQAFFIYSDVHMYYEKLDFPCTPKSWNISDDLGQIEYIFSDKTGTLTQNVMEFKKCSVNGVPYGEAYTEAEAGMQKRQGIDVEAEGTRLREQIAQDRVRMLDMLKQKHPNPYLNDDELTFIAPDYIADLDGESGKEQAAATERFMLALALCHTVITERTPGDPPRIEFKAQSPDEAALVSTARDCGFTVLGRSQDELLINVRGEDREYTILNTLEFNSSRKRMSAIVRMPDGKIMLFCKGADSMIYSRLKRGEQVDLRRSTAEHLEMFAREGLRTLCVAQRELNEEEYQEWNKRHDMAAAAIQNREEELEAVSDEIERNLSLIGGTAIEDRLQDGVPDAIALLGEAGIKLWVLTGDKVETAINIGFSCNLLSNDMDLIVLKDSGDAEQPVEEAMKRMEASLMDHLATFGLTGSDEELTLARADHGAPGATHAVVIDGDALKLVLEDSLRQKFLLLCKQCRAVLCCRVSPAQKAAVVLMVQTGLDVVTLSIGDGANDVAMIQVAHVGVGIAGEEGRQAVMSSDYAIGQFRFLTRLVLVHGRWSYRRLGEMIANFFYKNMVWTLALFWYQIYNNFDVSYLFDYTYILLYNLAFTSVPVILMGVLDQDVSDKVSLAVPQLYRRGIERKEWTQRKFWLYMLDGAYQSVICFFFGYLVFYQGTFASESGLNINDGKRIGIYVGTVAVFAANSYILMNTYRWDWLMLLITSISILLVWFWTGVYTSFTSGFTFYKAAPQVYGELSFWAEILVAIIVALLPRFVIKSIQKLYFPRDIDIIREQVRAGKFDYLDHTDNMIAPPKPHEVKASDSGSSNDGSPRKNPADSSKNPFGDTTSQHTYGHQQQGSDGTEYTSDPRRPVTAEDYTRDSKVRSPVPDFSAFDGHRGSGGQWAQSVPRVDQRSPESEQFMTPTESIAPAIASMDNRLPHESGIQSPEPGQRSRPVSGAYVTSPAPEATSRPKLQTRLSGNDIHRPSLEVPSSARPRPSGDRARPSFDRMRSSLDRVRPSFEQGGSGFQSAASLLRMESRDSGEYQRRSPRRSGDLSRTVTTEVLGEDDAGH